MDATTINCGPSTSLRVVTEKWKDMHVTRYLSSIIAMLHKKEHAFNVIFFNFSPRNFFQSSNQIAGHMYLSRFCLPCNFFKKMLKGFWAPCGSLGCVSVTEGTELVESPHVSYAYDLWSQPNTRGCTIIFYIGLVTVRLYPNICFSVLCHDVNTTLTYIDRPMFSSALDRLQKSSSI